MGKKILKDRIFASLKKRGNIDSARLDRVIDEASQSGGVDIIVSLVESGAVSDSELLVVLCEEVKAPPIDVSRVNLDKEVMAVVPEKLAKRHGVVPLSKMGNTLALVVSNPTDVFVIDDIGTVTGCDIELVLATRRNLKDAITAFYKEEDAEMSSIIDDDEMGDVEVIGKSDGLDIQGMEKDSATAPIVKMVDLIISEAIKKRASDIHIEPQEKSLRIRYRIDGELHSVFDLPKKNQNSIIARLKIMSNLDITETRVPQDGRFRVKLDGKTIDFRVSVLPLNFGNKIVMRALDKSNLSVGLETLGFLPGPLSDFKKALERPFGILLVTGPTGSGKSTTLYSVLTEMNTPDRNIVTVEDPVEYQVAGITQIATRAEIGLDFSSALRALLRQSPDVIMVGEIRDYETADIAIKASLTGQMVLSTLHTNDAVGSITRLVNMGIEPFLVASSLIFVCAQRLLKRICQYCKVEYDMPKEEREELSSRYPALKNIEKLYSGKGCPRCNGTGYLGRMGTLETVLIDDTIRDMIHKQKPEGDLREYLKFRGIGTLRDNAMAKFIDGRTTLEEVYRVT